MTTYLFGTRALILALLGVSIAAVALVLHFLMTQDQTADTLTIRPWRQGINDILEFLSGPLPLSIALHLGVLLFLMAGAIQQIEQQPMLVQFENRGGGGGGGGTSGGVGQPELKLPKMPDVSMPETPPQDVESPPQVELPRDEGLQLPAGHVEYFRSTSPGGFGPGTEGGMGSGSGGGIGSGHGRGMGSGFGGYIGALRARGLDLVLVIDGTSSMRFVIEDVKTRMMQLVFAVHRLVPTARIGVVLFSGKGERIAVEPFTLSSPRINTFLRGIKAHKGGDWQEDTLSAVRIAVEQTPWNAGAKKVIVMVGDTPPFAGDSVEIMNLVKKFRAEDGAFNTIDVTVEEHQRFAREMYYFIHHQYPNTIPPLPDFYPETQRFFQEMAKTGGGEWSSLTRDEEINDQVIILALGHNWRAQTTSFKPVAVSISQQRKDGP